MKTIPVSTRMIKSCVVKKSPTFEPKRKSIETITTYSRFPSGGKVTAVQMLDIAKPRCIFVPLNQYGCPNIEPKLFKIRFVKRSYTQLESAFSANPDTISSKKFFHKTMVMVLQFHLSTQ